MVGWGQKIALIRFFYKIDPEKLSIEEWAKYESELLYLSEVGIINIKLQ